MVRLGGAAAIGYFFRKTPCIRPCKLASASVPRTLPPETANTSVRDRVTNSKIESMGNAYLMTAATLPEALRCHAASTDRAPRVGRWVGWFVRRASEAGVNREAVNALTKDGEGWSFKRSKDCAAPKAEASLHGRINGVPRNELPGPPNFGRLRDV